MDAKTALFEQHMLAGGKMVSFAGYQLPIQYSGILNEHRAVREAAGLFDVSHMGELLLTGPDALKNLNQILTNDFTNMANGQIRYSPLCYENGGVVDDLLVYKSHSSRYLVVVNAANRQKDAAWIQAHLRGEVECIDVSAYIAQIALQGPLAPEILAKITKDNYIPKKYYTFVENGWIGEIPCLISRTGYTGEKGYEIYCENAYAAELWEKIWKAGESDGLLPCGLGCRDTLRLEAAMPLYGHELSPEISPLEAGLGSFVKLEKDFIGRQALLGDSKRRRIGLELLERGIAREGAKVFFGERKAGVVTSGTMSPTLGKPIALALVDASLKADELPIWIEVRNKKLQAKMVPLPFYKAKK